MPPDMKRGSSVGGGDDTAPEWEGSVEKKSDLEADTGTISDAGLSRVGATLHPQPTTDHLDPLNWTSTRKHIILAIVMFKYFLFTYITSTTVPSFAGLQSELSISYSQVSWTVAIPALGLALGPLFWSSLADIYGRRIIFVTGTAIALAATIGAAARRTYGGYMAARFFQGFGVSPAATVGMAVIGDLFFEHERGQKLGLWVLAIDSGLLVGPILGGFLDLVSSAWVSWFTSILFATLLVLELAFMPETLYPRGTILNHTQSSDTSGLPATANAAGMNVKRTKELPFLNFKSVPGMRHPHPWDSVLRFFQLFRYPVVVLGVGVYCFAWYWWILSIITMLPSAYVSYRPQIQGLLFLGLLLGTLFSEIFCSGRLSDYIVARLAHRNRGVRMPEMRLWLTYPAALLSAVGLILWGISIDKAYHWIVGQVAFFIFAAGIQMGNTCITSYIVDSYPLQSMSVITFYSVFLNLSAFINPFFISPWQAATGWTWTFATQGIITFFASTPILIALQVWGPRLRLKSGSPSWINAEYDSL